ncbi:hypothetical protein ACFLXI_08110, partial [Chloroflexota bacterium]
ENKNMKKIINQTFISSTIWVVSFPAIIFAYIGPGSGLSAIGAFLACLAGIVVTILGFLWYPIKRLLGKEKKIQEPDQINDEKD